MVTVNVEEANPQLSHLLEQVEGGEEVVIARNGTPVARLERIQRPRGTPQFGSWKGRLKLDDSFFDPLPPEELAAWEGAYDTIEMGEEREP